MNDVSLWWRMFEMVVVSALMIYLLRSADERAERQRRFFEQLLEIRIQPQIERQTHAVNKIYLQLSQLDALLQRLNERKNRDR